MIGAGELINYSRVNGANAIIRVVGDVDCSRAIHRDTHGIVQLRGSCRPAVAAIARGAAGQQVDDVGSSSHLADCIVVVIRDVEVALRVHSHVEWIAKHRRSG